MGFKTQKNLPIFHLVHQHEVFSLSKKDGLNNSEISLHLGISVKTIVEQITKALKILRLNLEKE